MARRINEVRGRDVRLVPTWSGLFGTSLAGDVLLPGEGARIAPTTFDEWLAGGSGVLRYGESVYVVNVR